MTLRAPWWLLMLVAAPLLAFGYDASQAAGDLAAGGALSERVPWAEVLGPLAPVALSPFFGMACLSGVSMLVTRGVLPENAFLDAHPVLTHPAFLGVFLLLAVFTSLPRLTKVSKPLALVCDTLETYAGIVAVVAVQLVRKLLEAPVGGEPVVAAGFAGIPTELLLAGLSVANFIVIQTVRLFFELLVWISPVPLLDAIFEAANKLVCAGLVALYAFSPWAALALNALLFLLCLALFRKAKQGVREIRIKISAGLDRLRAWRRARREVNPAASA